MRVAVVGTAPSGVYAPFDDPSWTIWGVGNRAEYFKRADRWYELHRLDGEPKEWAAEWRRLMKTWAGDCPVWMFYPEPELSANVVTFDPQPLLARFGSFFMTSSFSWIMAQAITEQVEEIGLWGVDMEYGTEYRQQRVGLRHFIDVAKLLNIKVTRVVTSGIAFEPVPYPMWGDDPILNKAKLRSTEFKRRKKEIEFSVHSMQQTALKRRGAQEEFEQMLAAWPDDPRANVEERAKKAKEAATDLERALSLNHADLNQIIGSLAELDWLEDYLQP